MLGRCGLCIFSLHWLLRLHSICFSMNYRLFALDYFDSVLCDASFQVPIIREIEKKRNLKAKQLPVVGSTYMDFNQQRLKELNIEKNKESVLYGFFDKHKDEIDIVITSEGKPVQQTEIPGYLKTILAENLEINSKLAEERLKEPLDNPNFDML